MMGRSTTDQRHNVSDPRLLLFLSNNLCKLYKLTLTSFYCGTKTEIKPANDTDRFFTGLKLFQLNRLLAP